MDGSASASGGDDVVGASSVGEEDTLSALVAGEGPCSIDDLSPSIDMTPDALCGDDAEKVLKLNASKSTTEDVVDSADKLGSSLDKPSNEQSSEEDIIDVGVPDTNVSGSPKETPISKDVTGNDDKAYPPPVTGTTKLVADDTKSGNDNANAPPVTDTAELIADDTKSLTESGSSSSSSDSDSDSSSSSGSSSSSSACSCPDCHTEGADSKSHNKPTSPVKPPKHVPSPESSKRPEPTSEPTLDPTSDLTRSSLEKYLNKIKPCRIELCNYNLTPDRCIQIKHLHKYISAVDLRRYNQRKRGRKPKSETSEKSVLLTDKKKQAGKQGPVQKQKAPKMKPSLVVDSFQRKPKDSDAKWKTAAKSSSFKSLQFVRSDDSSDDEPLGSNATKLVDVKCEPVSTPTYRPVGEDMSPPLSPPPLSPPPPQSVPSLSSRKLGKSDNSKPAKNSNKLDRKKSKPDVADKTKKKNKSSQIIGSKGKFKNSEKQNSSSSTVTKKIGESSTLSDINKEILQKQKGVKLSSAIATIQPTQTKIKDKPKSSKKQKLSSVDTTLEKYKSENNKLSADEALKQPKVLSTPSVEKVPEKESAMTPDLNDDCKDAVEVKDSSKCAEQLKDSCIDTQSVTEIVSDDVATKACDEVSGNNTDKDDTNVMLHAAETKPSGIKQNDKVGEEKDSVVKKVEVRAGMPIIEEGMSSDVEKSKEDGLSSDIEKSEKDGITGNVVSEADKEKLGDKFSQLSEVSDTNVADMAIDKRIDECDVTTGEISKVKDDSESIVLDSAIESMEIRTVTETEVKPKDESGKQLADGADKAASSSEVALLLGEFGKTSTAKEIGTSSSDQVDSQSSVSILSKVPALASKFLSAESSANVQELLRQCGRCHIKLVDCIKYPDKHRLLSQRIIEYNKQRKEKRKEKRDRDTGVDESSKKRRQLDSTNSKPSSRSDSGDDTKPEVKSELQTDTKPPSQHLDPWSQAISTINMSKIPKKRSKPYTPPAASGPVESASERLMKVQNALKSNLMTTPRVDKDKSFDYKYQDNAIKSASSYGRPAAFGANDNRSGFAVGQPSTYNRDWRRGEQRPAPYTNSKPYISAKPSNPYDDPDRIVRRDLRRKDFSKSGGTGTNHSKGFVDEAPPDTFMGDDSPPSSQQKKRGPRTPDLSKDPLGLNENIETLIPPKVENRFSSRDEIRTESRFSTVEEMSASLGKISSGPSARDDFLEEQRMLIQSMTLHHQKEVEENERRRSSGVAKQNTAMFTSREKTKGRLTGIENMEAMGSAWHREEDRFRAINEESVRQPRGVASSAQKQLEKGMAMLNAEREHIRREQEELQRLKAQTYHQQQQQRQQEQQQYQQSTVGEHDDELSERNLEREREKRQMIAPTGFVRGVPVPLPPKESNQPSRTKTKAKAAAQAQLLAEGATEAGGLMSQTVLDEIARISLEISKQIAVATGVPESKISKDKQGDKATKGKHKASTSANSIFEKRKAKIKELISSSSLVPPPPVEPPPPLPPSDEMEPLPSFAAPFSSNEAPPPPPIPDSPESVPPPPRSPEKGSTMTAQRAQENFSHFDSSYNQKTLPPPSRRNGRLHLHPPPLPPQFRPLVPPPLPPAPSMLPPPDRARLNRRPYDNAPTPSDRWVTDQRISDQHISNQRVSSEWGPRSRMPSQRVRNPPQEPELTEEQQAMKAMGLPVMFSERPLGGYEAEPGPVRRSPQRVPEDSPTVGVEDDRMRAVNEHYIREEGEILDDVPSHHHNQVVPVGRPAASQRKRDPPAKRRKFDGFSFANDLVSEDEEDDISNPSNTDFDGEPLTPVDQEPGNNSEEPVRTLHEWQAYMHDNLGATPPQPTNSGTTQINSMNGSRRPPQADRVKNTSRLNSGPDGMSPRYPLASREEEQGVVAVPFSQQEMSMISNRISSQDIRDGEGGAGDQLIAEYRVHLSDIMDNKTSSSVYSALNNILHIHDSWSSPALAMIRNNSNIPDLNDIFNKSLINILVHEDLYHLVQAAKRADKYPVEIHPKMQAALQQIVDGTI